MHRENITISQMDKSLREVMDGMGLDQFLTEIIEE